MDRNRSETDLPSLEPRDFVKELGIRRLYPWEKETMISTFRTRALETVGNLRLDGPGPLMLPTELERPIIEAEKLAGQQAIGFEVGGTHVRLGLIEIGPDGLPFFVEEAKLIPIPKE